LTYLEDIQPTVIFTHIRRKEESWNFKTRFKEGDHGLEGRNAA